MSLWTPITCYFSEGFKIKVRFWFFEKQNYLSTIRFCNRTETFNHFIGATHKATETFAKDYPNKN